MTKTTSMNNDLNSLAWGPLVHTPKPHFAADFFVHKIGRSMLFPQTQNLSAASSPRTGDVAKTAQTGDGAMVVLSRAPMCS